MQGVKLDWVAASMRLSSIPTFLRERSKDRQAGTASDATTICNTVSVSVDLFGSSSLTKANDSLWRPRSFRHPYVYTARPDRERKGEAFSTTCAASCIAWRACGEFATQIGDKAPEHRQGYIGISISKYTCKRQWEARSDSSRSRYLNARGAGLHESQQEVSACYLNSELFP